MALSQPAPPYSVAQANLELLRQRLREALYAKKTRLRELAELCQAQRAELRGMIKQHREQALAELREELRQARGAAAANRRTRLQDARRSATSSVELARAAVQIERAHAAEHLQITRAHDIKRVAIDKAHARSLSSDLMSAATIKRLGPLLEKAGKVRPAPGESRTEALWRYARAHPEEMHALLEPKTERTIAETQKEIAQAEAALRSGGPLPRTLVQPQKPAPAKIARPTQALKPSKPQWKPRAAPSPTALRVAPPPRPQESPKPKQSPQPARPKETVEKALRSGGPLALRGAPLPRPQEPPKPKQSPQPARPKETVEKALRSGGPLKRAQQKPQESPKKAPAGAASNAPATPVTIVEPQEPAADEAGAVPAPAQAEAAPAPAAPTVAPSPSPPRPARSRAQRPRPQLGLDFNAALPAAAPVGRTAVAPPPEPGRIAAEGERGEPPPPPVARRKPGRGSRASSPTANPQEPPALSVEATAAASAPVEQDSPVRVSADVAEAARLPTCSASYDPGDNKLRLRSSRRLDPETYARVKAAGFGWAPKQDLFVAPAWTPQREDLLLELCGEIDDEDTSLVDRAEVRAERFEGYQERRAADADRAHTAVARIADGIPLGQPILIGHHSERRARKDAEKIQGGMRKAVRLWETSQYWERRAKGALHHAKYKELPGVRQRRIKGLESDVRRQEKRIKESTVFLKLWSREGLTAESAQKIANVDHGTGVDAWYRLDRVRKDGSAEEIAKVTADVVAKAIESHTRAIEAAKRWLGHLGLRLTYERAMLGDIPEPVKPKRALLPMANYPGDGFEPMTKAQWAGIHADYKGSRIVRGARVRTAIVRHALVGVYLTDSKRVDPPGEGGDAVPRFKERSEPEPRARFTHTVEKPAPTPFDAMKASLKAGVQVVSAPQLFPTPPELAERVAELANIQPGERVLEPSAGTGSLLRAVLATTPDADVVAVEISADLARALAPKPGDGRYSVRHADFLTLGPSELGTFDCVVMNPPFASGADVKHILHARTLLKPDGRLVAICADGPRQRAALQPLADTWEELPEESFKSAGTNVRTVLLTMRAASGDQRAKRRSTVSAQTAASEPSS